MVPQLGRYVLNIGKAKAAGDIAKDVDAPVRIYSRFYQALGVLDFRNIAVHRCSFAAHVAYGLRRGFGVAAFGCVAFYIPLLLFG
jgi:hypothetical protein